MGASTLLLVSFWILMALVSSGTGDRYRTYHCDGQYCHGLQQQPQQPLVGQTVDPTMLVCQPNSTLPLYFVTIKRDQFGRCHPQQPAYKRPHRQSA